MKKNVLHKLFLSLTLVFSFSALYAQQAVTNGGFESWTGTSLDSWDKGYQSVLTKSTDAHSGNFALQLINGDAQGMTASVTMNKVGSDLPVKLKGFIKYDISPNQRTHISVSLGRTIVFASGSSTTFDKAGWVSFTGSSNNQYVPFEIAMDYRLIKAIPNNNGVIDFDKIQISVDSYGPMTASTNIVTDVNSPDIKANSFVMFDDFTFEGTTANSGIAKLVGVPDMLETWSLMDGHYIPTGLLLSGSNGVSNDLNRIISRSTDAHSGDYAMSVNLAGTDKSYGFFSVYNRVNATQTTLSFSVKGEMGTTDSIRVALGSGANQVKHLITGTDITNGYQTYTFDVTGFAIGSSTYVFISFFKNTFSTYSVLFDDIEVDGNSIPTAVKGSSLLNSIVASPNPSDGVFLLKNAGGNQINVFNVSGAAMHANIYDMGQDVRVDLTDSPKGIYFIYIEEEGAIKVIKE